MKRCSYCQKAFLKTEHLLRHERSHTGEKPYPCNKCGRRYARSDVLLRHVKFFHSQEKLSGPQQDTHAAESEPQSTCINRDLLASNDSNHIDANGDGAETIHVAPQTGDPATPAPDAAEEEPPQTTDQLMTTDMDTLAAASILQAQSEGVNYHSTADNGQQAQPNISFSAGGTTPPLSGMNTSTPSALTRIAGTPFPYDGQSFMGFVHMEPGFGTDPGEQGIADGAGARAGNADVQFPQNLEYLNFMDFSADMNLGDTAPSSSGSNLDPADSIPIERFTQVGRLWPNQSLKCMTDDEATRLWADVVAYKGDNILTDLTIAEASPVPSVGRESGSSWGLDDDRRLDLIRELTQDLPGFEGTADRFPPTRLLNLGLDCLQHEILTRLMLSQANAVAQVAGLFALRTSSASIDDLLRQYKTKRTLRGQSSEDDVMWKAWARTESVKRLIASLIVMDAWLAYRLEYTPFLRASAIRFEYPCPQEQFKCSSAAAWRRLINAGASPIGESVLIHVNNPIINLPASQDIATEGIFSLLSIIWIRMQHETSEVLTISQAEAPNANPEACSKNPNSVAMWHLLNLQLFAKMDMLELAAGRKGADGAHEALRAIAAWSQTWQARRACLHAGAIYTAMSRRRQKDGTMFHSEASIFSAALVLGLYVFMMGPSCDGSKGCGVGTPAEPYEFLNHVDWSKLGNAAGEDPVALSEDMASESAASRFVRLGGAVSFSGVICDGGYNASKMILLEFASLLEEVGKWKYKGSVHILRIMSDSLIEFDSGELM
uniref:C2H2-type domain-containing protein n=1 Tax=Bionectria ochroleuca TaxID=29856 RepID=A0A8H7KAC5_BIOOC